MVAKWLLFLFISSFPFVFFAEINETPVIGVLSQQPRYAKGNEPSYIAASYVKYLESAGARVVPILVNQPPGEYMKLFNSINGILLPGGAADITSSSYQRAAKIFYELAIDANKRGDYFPIWGTCLGFEQLSLLTSNETTLSRTNTTGLPMVLNFTQDAAGSKLFKDFLPETLQDLATEPMTVNIHKWSVAMKTYNGNEDLKKFYKVLSTNWDETTEFISTVEAYHYPIYGTQWHPEKNTFEWRMPYVPHTPSSIRAMSYMAQFFVNEARKNFHKFSSREEKDKALIHNYCPVIGPPHSVFDQIYYFPG